MTLVGADDDLVLVTAAAAEVDAEAAQPSTVAAEACDVDPALGQRARVAAGQLVAAHLVVEEMHPHAARGGVDGETVAEAKVRAPHQLRVQERVLNDRVTDANAQLANLRTELEEAQATIRTAEGQRDAALSARRPPLVVRTSGTSGPPSVITVSPSAIGKAISRLEQRLGTRLFHRSTRSITVTQEGSMFLERCRRVLCELEAAEVELAQTRAAPRGTLRVSLPIINVVAMPLLTGFMRAFPEVKLDLDFGDQLVDVIDGGYDADRMSGGAGNDVYYVNSFLDEVAEKAGEGTDTIRTGVESGSSETRTAEGWRR